MDRDEVLAVFDRQMRREARPDGPGIRVERAGDVARQVGPEHGWNGVIWSDLGPGNADAAIAEQVRYFGGRAFEWKLYAHDRPADLDRRLLAAGFTPEPEETLMVAEVGREGGDPSAVEVPEGVRLVPVTDRDGVELVAGVHDRAFGTTRDHIRERLLDQLAAGTVIAVVAMAGDVPISGARMDLHPGTRFASLWGGGTVPEWRGRGVYRALVAYRAREAAARGYDYLQVDASSQSRPILLRLGFEPLTTTTPYVHA
ncbi:GNAT family N-acetyltransferase [Nonomuraea sp. M3C6]|uniref:GNAT family N-acetyltransferase n=1 Tax=Nonomuraea marmarensis TaxID=3351344 RepID=A0ABW7A6U6_9ACTN